MGSSKNLFVLFQQKKKKKIDEAGYRCPYYGCVLQNAKRSRIYQHIREIHDFHFPKLSGTHKRYIIKSKLTNRKIDFKGLYLFKYTICLHICVYM